VLPKTGKRFPGGNDRESGGSGYAAIIAGALAKELGDTHRAAKVLMGWTGAGERTVKHWLAGLHGPTGDHLLVLMQESDAVFEAVVTAINRRDAAIAVRMLAAQRSLQEVASLMHLEHVRPPVADEPAASGQGSKRTRGPNDRENDRNRDRDHDRESAETSPRSGLRQSWFLEALRAGRCIGAAELAERWGISEKTARRRYRPSESHGLDRVLGLTPVRAIPADIVENVLRRAPDGRDAPIRLE
jgi:hypothetical protein